MAKNTEKEPFVFRFEKGERGYIKSKKILDLLICFGFMILIAGMIIASRVITNFTGKVFLVMGILFVLPFANFFVNYLSFSSFTDIDAATYERAKGMVKSGLLLTGLCLTNEKFKTLPIELAYIHSHDVVVLPAEHKNSDLLTPKEIEDYIERMMRVGKVDVHVACIKDKEKFFEKVAYLEANFPCENPEENRLLTECRVNMKAISL